jgi:hypothetical protein
MEYETINEHDRIVLRSDLPDERLRSGDVGTVVHIHGSGEAFEVEFCTFHGDTVAVATVSADQVRPIDHNDMSHARTLS